MLSQEEPRRAAYIHSAGLETASSTHPANLGRVGVFRRVEKGPKLTRFSFGAI
jgi:hypothetical protein